MATALRHKQRSSRSYQKNHKTMGAAIQSMANAMYMTDIRLRVSHWDFGLKQKLFGMCQNTLYLFAVCTVMQNRICKETGF